MNKIKSAGIPLILLVLGILAIFLWLSLSTPPNIPVRVPEKDTGSAVSTIKEMQKGVLTKGAATPSIDKGGWPQFRGMDRTNIAWAETGLTRNFGAEGAKVKWKVKVGDGYGGAAINKGRVYIIDYDKPNKSDFIRCLSLSDGKDIWSYSYKSKAPPNHGVSRTIPAVTDDHVVTLGPQCHVYCLKAKSGEFVWKIDLKKEYGTEVPDWYAGQCPLIDGSLVILAPGGTDILMMAVEISTGKVKWTTKNPGKWGMTHSSITPMEFKGVKQYIYPSTKGVVSVNAKDGSILWQDPTWLVGTSIMPAPVVVGTDKVLLTGGYGAGAKMLKLKEEGGKITYSQAFKVGALVFGSQQATPIFYNNYIYGVIEGDGKKEGTELVCLSTDGSPVWKSEKATFGLGPYIIADGIIYILNDFDNTLHMVEAASAGYKDLGSVKVLNGREAWAPIALADGRMIVRDFSEMVCLDLRK